MKTYQIHFVRHGITDGNLLGQYIGSTDLPLCSEGFEQLEELRRKYDYPQAQAYLCSPMLRCKQSLELLYPDATPIVIDDLRECDFGELEGHSAKELEGDERFAKWIAGGAQESPFGGESGERFSTRVCSAFEQVVAGLLKTGTTSAVIVTHAGVISSLLSRYGLPRADPSAWYCEPGNGYSVIIHVGLWLNGQVFEVKSRLLDGREID